MERMYYLIGAGYQNNFDMRTAVVIPMIYCSRNLSSMLARLRNIYYSCLDDEQISDLCTNTVYENCEGELVEAVIDENTFFEKYEFWKPYVSFTLTKAEDSYYMAQYLVISDEDFVQL